MSAKSHEELWKKLWELDKVVGDLALHLQERVAANPRWTALEEDLVAFTIYPPPYAQDKRAWTWHEAKKEFVPFNPNERGGPKLWEGTHKLFEELVEQFLSESPRGNSSVVLLDLVHWERMARSKQIDDRLLRHMSISHPTDEESRRRLRQIMVGEQLGLTDLALEFGSELGRPTLRFDPLVVTWYPPGAQVPRRLLPDCYDNLFASYEMEPGPGEPASIYLKFMPSGVQDNEALASGLEVLHRRLRLNSKVQRGTDLDSLKTETCKAFHHHLLCMRALNHNKPLTEPVRLFIAPASKMQPARSGVIIIFADEARVGTEEDRAHNVLRLARGVGQAMDGIQVALTFILEAARTARMNVMHQFPKDLAAVELELDRFRERYDRARADNPELPPPPDLSSMEVTSMFMSAERGRLEELPVACAKICYGVMSAPSLETLVDRVVWWPAIRMAQGHPAVENRLQKGQLTWQDLWPESGHFQRPRLRVDAPFQVKHASGLYPLLMLALRVAYAYVISSFLGGFLREHDAAQVIVKWDGEKEVVSVSVAASPDSPDWPRDWNRDFTSFHLLTDQWRVVENEQDKEPSGRLTIRIRSGGNQT